MAAKKSTTPTPKSASKPIKGTPRPKAPSNDKTTPASIKKKPSSSSASKTKRSATKSAPKSATRSTARKSAANKSSVSPIKEISFTFSGDNEFKTPAKLASSAKKRPASARSTKSTRSATKPASRPSSPAKSQQAKQNLSLKQEENYNHFANLLNIKEYCSIM